jgi:hypothetical protein
MSTCVLIGNKLADAQVTVYTMHMRIVPELTSEQLTCHVEPYALLCQPLLQLSSVGQQLVVVYLASLLVVYVLLQPY